jgi:arabinose-5-phosphate isomerase
MSEVLVEMTSKHLGCTGVINDQEELLGIITDGDLRRHIDQNFLNHLAEEIMTKNPVTTSPSTLAVEAIAIMNKKSITSLFVLEGQKIVGILHLHDCLRAGIA